MSPNLPKKITFTYSLELIGAYFLAAFWILPLIYAFWAAFHTGEYATRFDIFAPLTLAIRPGTISAVRNKHIFCHCILATTSIISFNFGGLCICSFQLCWVQCCV
jgi:sn-glycerol 3-phosphate transport system permease protein